MATIEEALQLGLSHYQAGRWPQAEQIYRQIIEANPRIPQPHLLLGILQASTGDLQSSVANLRRTIELDDKLADAHFALGNVLRRLGDRDASRVCYERAVEIHPEFYEALLNLASVSREAGLVDRARDCIHQAIRLRPQSADGPFYMGNLEAERQDWPAAIACYQDALRLNPNLASAEARLGSALQASGQTDEAVAHYRRAIQLEPTLAEAHYNLGIALADQGHAQEAIGQYERTLLYDPSFLDAHINLGANSLAKGDEEQALVHIHRALEIDDSALEPRFNRALIMLRRGELAPAWSDFQARLQLPGFPARAFREPLWDGSPIPGKTLLIHREQGFGDTIQFIRYVERVKEKCKKALIQVQPALVPLLRQSGFENLFADGDQLPPIDYHIPMMSLPGACGTTLETIFADVPYLSVADEAVENWRERLSHLKGTRVGIVWQGSRTHKSDIERSILLSEFAPLARIPGVTLVSLQKRDGVEQLHEVPFAVHELEGNWDESAGAFVDTAAVMKNLDLVITADTASAHLAGALAVPVWVALWIRGDWRWFKNREDSPWYPTMRLFRQSKEGDWAEVFARMAAQLEHLARK